MSWVRIWVHLVFSTKDRVPSLHSKEIREKVFRHIKENAQTKSIWLDHINGHHEHTHCLISLGKDQTISKIAQLIKGESSYWINHNQLIREKFIWQDDFWAVSVSESHLISVRKYIQQQEEHHTRKPFTNEVEDFMKKYGWALINTK